MLLYDELAAAVCVLIRAFSNKHELILYNTALILLLGAVQTGRVPSGESV